MAQKLLEKYNIPYFSMDNLKMGLFRSNKSSSFTPTDSNEVISQKIWPITREMIKTIIENDQSIIIEGCYYFPEFYSDFSSEYLRKIISVFLVFSPGYLKQSFHINVIRHRNAIETRKHPEERPLSQFIVEHRDLKERCIKYGAKYFEINSDYEKEIEEVYQYIDHKIKKHGYKNSN